MNISITRSGIAASALLLAFATAAPGIAQSPPGTIKPQDRNQGSTLQGQQGMEKIGSAYKQLHQVTLSALQDHARDWKDRPANGTTRDTATVSDTTSMTLRGEELLIAGCPEGLLAGAPSGASNRDTRKGASAPFGDNKSDSKSDSNPSPQSNPGRTDQGAGAAGSDGQSIGMLLVCAHATDGAKTSLDSKGLKQDGDGKSSDRDREVAGDRDSGLRNASASSSTGSLKPGVYCVKQSGSSVWLADQEGRIVLRTTVDAQRDKANQKPSELGGREQQPGFAAQRAGDQSEWEQVFASISEEAMNSMGWAKQSAVASMRQ